MTERERWIAERAAELLTIKEYAALARMSERSVRRLLGRGGLAGAVRVGGQWRIDIAAWHVLSSSRDARSA